MALENYISLAVKRHLSPVAPFMEDETVSEIMINPGGTVFVEKAGEMAKTDVTFTEERIASALIAVAKSSPSGLNGKVVTAAFENMRFSGALKPVSPDGSFITIRRHPSAKSRPGLEQLVSSGSLSQQQADFIVSEIIGKKRNAIFAGGTGSGKTTLINAVLAKLAPDERVFVIEDAKELSVRSENAVSVITGELITAKDAVKLALRQRPDRIVLGETRGDETFDLIRALNTGHPGSVSSVHADSAEKALDVLTVLYQNSAPVQSVSSDTSVRRTVASAVSLVVFCERTKPNGGTGNGKSSRHVSEIVRVKGVRENGSFETETVTF